MWRVGNPPLAPLAQELPQQFTRLIGAESLFQASARRLAGPGFAAPLVITGSDYRFIVTEQLLEAGIDPGGVLIEPEGRNTAPAVLAAALHLAKTDPRALILVAPSDHVVPDAAAFRAAVEAGIPAAMAGKIVTFGIRPTRAETGYGWLELATAPRDGFANPLTRFVEKPKRDVAEAMLASGNFLWNAGIFLFTADTILGAFRAHCPALLPPSPPLWKRPAPIWASCASTLMHGPRPMPYPWIML